MKLLALLLLFSLFICTFSYAQTDSTALTYYPLNNSDYWQYMKFTQDNSGIPQSFTSYYSMEVLGDSTLPNGKSYKILEKTHLGPSQLKQYFFERIDSLTGNVYRYDQWATNNEIFLDSLKSQLGDSSLAGRPAAGLNYQESICDSLYADTVLNFPTLSKRIRSLTPINEEHHILSEGLGLIYQVSGYDFGYTDITLKYAKINGIEYGTPVNIESSKNNMIQAFQLQQNYPNPFNPETTIRYSIPEAGTVELRIFDVLGRAVKILEQQFKAAGEYQIIWNGKNEADHSMSSGIYFYELKAKSIIGNQNFFEMKKMILIK